MENKKIIIAEILVLVVLTQLASAISIEIEGKDSFGLGDEISFTYTLLSEVTQEVEYLAVASCPSAPLSLLEIKNMTLKANIPFTESYIYLSSVSEDIEAQRCNISVGILNPETVERKSFEIIADSSFEFNALSCKDSSCNEIIKVFILNEDIYLDYISEVSDVITEAVLIYPDKTTEKLSLPTSIKAKQTGTYNLNIIASSLGYKDMSKEIEFGVIEKEVVIPYTDVKDAKEIEASKEDADKSNTLFVIISISVIILALACIFFFLKFKHNKKPINNSKSKNKKLIFNRNS